MGDVWYANDENVYALLVSIQQTTVRNSYFYSKSEVKILFIGLFWYYSCARGSLQRNTTQCNIIIYVNAYNI